MMGRRIALLPGLARADIAYFALHGGPKIGYGEAPRRTLAKAHDDARRIERRRWRVADEAAEKADAL